ncbi:MAG: glycosyltransferase [Ignisphaera sp.]|uniref:glycosyltransferase family 2 protein n=1 Tax=Desulfurococcus sp. TaxID=51678 RepID=UPI0031694676
MEPFISVIIRAYNAEKYIRDAVGSVFNQRCKCPIEVIILYDEGTIDRTLEIIEELQETVDAENTMLRVIRHTHISPFRSLQIGLKEARGEYVTILDYDNMYLPEYLEMIRKNTEEHPEATFLFTRAMMVAKDGKIIKELVSIPENPYDINRLIKWNYIDGNTIVLKRTCKEIVEKLLSKLQHRSFDWIYEDWLIAAIGLRFCKPLFVKDAFVYYRVHESNTTYSLSNDYIKTLFNIERDVNTLIAMSYIFNGDEKLRSQIAKSLMSRYLRFIMISTHILQLSHTKLLSLTASMALSKVFSKRKLF